MLIKEVICYIKPYFIKIKSLDTPTIPLNYFLQLLVHKLTNMHIYTLYVYAENFKKQQFLHQQLVIVGVRMLICFLVCNNITA